MDRTTEYVDKLPNVKDNSYNILQKSRFIEYLPIATKETLCFLASSRAKLGHKAVASTVRLYYLAISIVTALFGKTLTIPRIGYDPLAGSKFHQQKIILIYIDTPYAIDMGRYSEDKQ